MGYRACTPAAHTFPRSANVLRLRGLDMHERAVGQTRRQQLQHLWQHVHAKRRIEKYHVITPRVEAQKF